MKLSGVLVGMVFVVFILTAFLVVISRGADDYGITDYEEGGFSNVRSSLGQINNISIQTKERVESVKANPLIPDTLGVLVVGSIGGLTTAASSVDVFTSVITSGVPYLPLGGLNEVLVAVLITSLVILIFIGIFMYYIRGGVERL